MEPSVTEPSRNAGSPPDGASGASAASQAARPAAARRMDRRRMAASDWMIDDSFARRPECKHRGHPYSGANHLRDNHLTRMHPHSSSDSCTIVVKAPNVASPKLCREEDSDQPS